MTPEGYVKRDVKRLLAQHGAYYHMSVQNGMGSPTLDFTGCHDGRFFAVETKAGNGQMTARQTATAQAMRASGGQVFLVNDREGLTALDTWLRHA